MSNVPMFERVPKMMSNTEAPPVEADHSRDEARGWRAHLPVVAFAFVIVCLLTLAVTPIVMIRRLDGLRRVANGTVGAARPIAGDLRLLFVEEADDHQRFILERDTEALARYRTHRSDERRLFIRLAALAGEIGSPTDADVDELRSRADRWHALTDLQVEQRISPAALAAALPRLTAGRDSVLAASAQVRADLNRAYDLDTAKGTAILDDQRLVSATLGVLALLTTLVIAWFAQRERALGRALTRAVAEEARLRVESERRREELERITETKNGLIRGFTHDVKNPIGAADGYLQMLAEGLFGPLGEKQRTGIERAHRSLASALELIGDLLELSRAEAAHFHVQRVPTNVVDIVRDAAEEYRAQAEAKGLTLSVDCHDDIPIIATDPGRVRQVLGQPDLERGEVHRCRIGHDPGACPPGRGRSVGVRGGCGHRTGDPEGEAAPRLPRVRSPRPLGRRWCRNRARHQRSHRLRDRRVDRDEERSRTRLDLRALPAAG
jgi:signal transduction histidine kinase